MAYSKADYYTECVSDAAAEIGLSLTHDQAKYIGEAVENYAENVGMAFYQPSASERCNQIEREWEAKYKVLKKEFDVYREDAETAVKIALRQRRDTNVSIGKHGEVVRYDGRSDRIQ